jgi:hypothetical protein
MTKSQDLKSKNKRNRRTNAQLFLDTLKQMGGDKQLIGNKALRDKLGWEEERYHRIRRELMIQNEVVSGAGRGGSVMLRRLSETKGLSAFISYSHVDERYKNELVKHLEPLRRLARIDAWHDRKLKPGDEWDQVISGNLDKADIILLLVSIDFINSRYCYDIELERALERHEKGEAKVVPVILRPCMWQHTPFAKLQSLPRDARAVSLWPDSDEAFVSIAEGVFTAANDLLDTV